LIIFRLPPVNRPCGPASSPFPQRPPSGNDDGMISQNGIKVRAQTPKLLGARRSRRFSVKSQGGLSICNTLLLPTLKRRERRAPSPNFVKLNSAKPCFAMRMSAKTDFVVNIFVPLRVHSSDVIHGF
jgi:hypothetical protein